jgi:hypothetical protein
MLTKEKLKFSLSKLNRNLNIIKEIGIDSELESALDLNRGRNYTRLTKNFNMDEIYQIIELVRKYMPFETLQQAYWAVVRELKKRFSINKCTAIEKEIAPYENKNSVQAYLNWQQYLPYNIIRLGIYDDGTLSKMENKDIPAGFIIKRINVNNTIAYKVVETKFEDLNIRQRRFLRALLFTESLRSGQEKVEFDFTIEAGKKKQKIIADKNFDFAPKVYHVEGNQLLGRTTHVIVGRNGPLPLYGWKLLFLIQLQYLNVLTVKSEIIYFTPLTQRRVYTFNNPKEIHLFNRVGDTYYPQEGISENYIHLILFSKHPGCVEIYNMWIANAYRNDDEKKFIQFINKVYKKSNYMLMKFYEMFNVSIDNFAELTSIVFQTGNYKSLLNRSWYDKIQNKDLLTKDEIVIFEKYFKWVPREQEIKYESNEIKKRQSFLSRTTDSSDFFVCSKYLFTRHELHKQDISM